MGGFDYTLVDQIEDGKQASDEFRINYIAKTLGVDPGTIRLTEDGFKLVGLAGSVYYAGKLTKPGGLLSDDPYLAKAENGGILNIGAGNKPIKDAYNISNPDYPMGQSVYPGNANDLSKIATGSQNKIIMDNPYKYDPLNSEILRVLNKNGSLVIRGGNTNRYVKYIEKLAEKKGLELVSKKEISSKGYTQSDGSPIKSLTITEFIFKKK